MIILPPHWIESPFKNLVSGIHLKNMADFDREARDFLSYVIERQYTNVEASEMGLRNFHWLVKNTKGKWSNHHEMFNLNDQIMVLVKYRFEFASDAVMFKLASI